MPPPLRFERSDVPIPTTRPPLSSATTMRRAKTLTRPERSVAPVPLIHNTPTSTDDSILSSSFDPWKIFSRVITFWAPGFLLSSIGGLHDKQKQQAWREKIALCAIIIAMCGTVGFITIGLQKVFCPQTTDTSRAQFLRIGSTPGVIGVHGVVFNTTQTTNTQIQTLAAQFSGQDITNRFSRPASYYTSCVGLSFRAAVDDPCPSIANCDLGPLNATSTFTALNLLREPLVVGYDWGQVANLSNYMVIDGAVLNMNPYMSLHPTQIPADTIDAAIRTILISQSSASGKDGTLLFYHRQDLKDAVPCLMERYFAGNIDKITTGCFISQLVLYAGLIVILSLVFIRFAMACVFNWYLSARLVANVSTDQLNKAAISPAVMPDGANLSIDNIHGTAPWAGPAGTKRLAKHNPRSTRSTATASSATLVPPPESAAPVMSLAHIGAELFAVCLVTCYSEGEESLRTTLDSISATTYSDARKLLFVVADGMITGAGEKRSTPDICVSLLEPDPRFGNPIPMSYIAVGSGAKQENRAMVYAGHYTVCGRRTPTVIVVKCGTEQEAAKDKKPGNRGKRDSQLILMNFFSHVTYNDRMTPLDFDLFRKIHVLMGVTPDYFEVCLMVDADTKAFPDSLRHLVNCMHNDQMIMGVCGETRIANKRQSWVTAIQVFEYFISHHMAKAFESVFGGVSCLPGCFSMFRLKARRISGDDWIPLIIKPEIVKEYSQNEVVTLHQKNLLLLGEDRFLTTILIRTFPNRKMMFLPQARCRTVVPDTFAVLLSQRRRWINSTVHNLMELTLVRNLCGTFCFSMQFIVGMDLVGTVVLPVAIVLTYVLIVGMIMSPPRSFEEAIPLLLLVAVLGLPAILILITTRKVVYVFWMLIYLLALPVWNFILPVYAFWHFDDFSWGETRKVEGEAKGEAHGEGLTKATPITVPLRRWEDWERSRLRKLKRDEKRKKDLERMHPFGYQTADEYLGARGDTRSQYDGSDTISLASSEDDHWGAQIGGYNENSTQYPPPPAGLMAKHVDTTSGKTVGGAELEAILEAGFDEPSPPPSRLNTLRPNELSRYHLSDGPVASHNGYTPLARSTSPTSPNTPVNGVSSGVAPEWKTHVKKRSGSRTNPMEYGPLGPLDPGSRI